MTEAVSPEPEPAAEAAAPGAPQLVWERKDGTQVHFPLSAAHVLIGRDEAVDVFIDEPLVSRLHARLERQDGTYVLRDLGSTNLTKVNGEVVTERALKDGDEVQFARAICRFRSPAADGPQAAGEQPS